MRLSTEQQAGLRLLIERYGLVGNPTTAEVERTLEDSATEYLMLINSPKLPPRKRRQAFEQGRKRARALLTWVEEHGLSDTAPGIYIRSGIERVFAGQDPWIEFNEARASRFFKDLRPGLVALIEAIDHLTSAKRQESQAQTGPLEYLIAALERVWADCKKGRAAVRNNIKDNPVKTPFRRFVDDVVTIIDPKKLKGVDHASRALNASRKLAEQEERVWAQKAKEEKLARAREQERTPAALAPQPTKAQLRDIERQMVRIFPPAPKPTKRGRAPR